VTGPAYWARFAATVALIAAILMVLDFGYGVPWLIRTPIAALSAVGFLELTERLWIRWHERARRNRLR
jgi:hypothetical protein